MPRATLHLIPTLDAGPPPGWEHRAWLSHGWAVLRAVADAVEAHEVLRVSLGCIDWLQHVERVEPALFARILALAHAGRCEAVLAGHPAAHASMGAEWRRRARLRTQTWLRTRFGQPARVVVARASGPNRPAADPVEELASGTRYLVTEDAAPDPARAGGAVLWAGNGLRQLLGWDRAPRLEAADGRLPVDALDGCTTGPSGATPIVLGLPPEPAGALHVLEGAAAWSTDASAPLARRISTWAAFWSQPGASARRPGRRPASASTRPAAGNTPTPAARTSEETAALRAEALDAIVAAALNRRHGDFRRVVDALTVPEAGSGSATRAAAADEAARLEHLALSELAREVDTQLPASSPGGLAFLAWNPLPAPVVAPVLLPGPVRLSEGDLAVTDATGRPLPHRWIRSGRLARLEVVVPLPAWGWQVLAVGPVPAGEGPRSRSRAHAPASAPAGDGSSIPAPFALPVPAKVGPLPRSGSFGRLEPAAVQVIALKPAEDGYGFVLRFRLEARRPAEAFLEFLGSTIPLGRLEPGTVRTWRLAQDNLAWVGRPVGLLEDEE